MKFLIYDIYEILRKNYNFEYSVTLSVDHLYLDHSWWRKMVFHKIKTTFDEILKGQVKGGCQLRGVALYWKIASGYTVQYYTTDPLNLNSLSEI